MYLLRKIICFGVLAIILSTQSAFGNAEANLSCWSNLLSAGGRAPNYYGNEVLSDSTLENQNACAVCAANPATGNNRSAIYGCLQRQIEREGPLRDRQLEEFALRLLRSGKRGATTGLARGSEAEANYARALANQIRSQCQGSFTQMMTHGAGELLGYRENGTQFVRARSSQRPTRAQAEDCVRDQLCPAPNSSWTAQNRNECRSWVASNGNPAGHARKLASLYRSAAYATAPNNGEASHVFPLAGFESGGAYQTRNTPTPVVARPPETRSDTCRFGSCTGRIERLAAHPTMRGTVPQECYNVANASFSAAQTGGISNMMRNVCGVTLNENQARSLQASGDLIGASRLQAAEAEMRLAWAQSAAANLTVLSGRPLTLNDLPNSCRQANVRALQTGIMQTSASIGRSASESLRLMSYESSGHDTRELISQLRNVGGNSNQARATLLSAIRRHPSLQGALGIAAGGMTEALDDLDGASAEEIREFTGKLEVYASRVTDPAWNSQRVSYGMQLEGQRHQAREALENICNPESMTWAHLVSMPSATQEVARNNPDLAPALGCLQGHARATEDFTMVGRAIGCTGVAIGSSVIFGPGAGAATVVSMGCFASGIPHALHEREIAGNLSAVQNSCNSFVRGQAAQGVNIPPNFCSNAGVLEAANRVAAADRTVMFEIAVVAMAPALGLIGHSLGHHLGHILEAGGRQVTPGMLNAIATGLTRMGATALQGQSLSIIEAFAHYGLEGQLHHLVVHMAEVDVERAEVLREEIARYEAGAAGDRTIASNQTGEVR